MKHPRWVIEDLARDHFPESAVCLECGALQVVQERRLLVGLCDECDERAVVPVKIVKKALDVVQDEEGDDDD